MKSMKTPNNTKIYIHLMHVFFSSCFAGTICPQFKRSSDFYSNSFVWNNTCYGIAKLTSFTRSQAIEFCEVRNSDLLYLESEDEMAAVSSWVTKHATRIRIWTGGYRRRTTSSTWYWTTKRGGEMKIMHI